MKKIFALLCAGMIGIGSIQASVVLRESFDRSLGTLSTSTWSSGGTLPNDSNWHTYSPGSVQFQVVNGQLTKSDYCSATSGKAVQFSANHSRDYILFKNALSGEKAYLAFLLKASVLQTTQNAMSASNANNSIMSFAIDASNNALGSLNGRVIIQSVDENTFHLGVSRRGETPQFAANSLKTGETYLVVAEYEFVEGEKNDLVRLYINPTPEEQNAAVVSVNPSTASADAGSLVGIALCSNGNTPTGMLIDEIRVVSQWSELWEDSSQPQPEIQVKSSLAFGEVTTGAAIEKTIQVSGSSLQGGISVASNNSALVPKVNTISKAEAEAGYSLALTLTAPKDGAGNAEVTLSSAGASDQIITVSWTAKAPVPAAGTNLLANGSFEENSCNAMFGCSFDDWSWNGSGASVESEDVAEGEEAMRVQPTRNGILEQDISLTDADYAGGTPFELKLHYKAQSLPEGGAIGLDCYWTPISSGNADEMKKHDAELLQRAICTEAGNEWQEFSVRTTKPVNSSKLLIRVTVPKNANVLFDDFSLVEAEQNEPFISVTPNKVSSVSCEIGESVDFQTIHIKQGNLEGPTTFYIGGSDKGHFRLSASELAADQSDLDLIITYAPTSAGTHSASLIFDNAQHTTILPDIISLRGSCTDPSAVPTISVTSEIPSFETIVGKQISGKITVKSENCTDYVYLSVNHVEGAAFTTVESVLAKNWESEVTIYFTPLEEGTYQSTLTLRTEGAEPVVVTLNGKAVAQSEETIDWSTSFRWDMTNPRALLNEDFESVKHNETVLLDGWQNIAKADARPWRGQDNSQVSYAGNDNKSAKATAYQYGKDSTDTWEMWLVTPALDYKNAEGKIFAFSVMGEYMPDDGNKASFDLFYIDATDPNNVFFQQFDGLSIPKTADENNVWVPFQIHLENQPNIADVFFFAFRYKSPNGGDGTVTYYVDEVSWGRTDLPNTEGFEDVQRDEVPSRKVLQNGVLYILRGEKKYSILGIEL